MQKRLAIYGTFMAICLGYIAFISYCCFVDGVTETNYRRLEIGMTKRQTRALLGFSPNATHHWVKGQVHEDWIGPEGTVMLAFDDQERLIWKDWNKNQRRRTLQEKWENIGENWWYVVRE